MNTKKMISVLFGVFLLPLFAHAAAEPMRDQVAPFQDTKISIPGYSATTQVFPTASNHWLIKNFNGVLAYNWSTQKTQVTYLNIKSVVSSLKSERALGFEDGSKTGLSFVSLLSPQDGSAISVPVAFSNLSAMEVSPKGHWAIASFEDGTFVRADLNANSLKTIKIPAAQYTQVYFDKAETKVLLHARKAFCVIDLGLGKVIHSKTTTESIPRIAFSGDGKAVAYLQRANSLAKKTSKVALYSLSSKTLIEEELPENADWLWFSADSKKLTVNINGLSEALILNSVTLDQEGSVHLTPAGQSQRSYLLSNNMLLNTAGDMVPTTGPVWGSLEIVDALTQRSWSAQLSDVPFHPVMYDESMEIFTSVLYNGNDLAWLNLSKKEFGQISAPAGTRFEAWALTPDSKELQVVYRTTKHTGSIDMVLRTVQLH